MDFDQSGGSADGDASKSSDWAVLNKVMGAAAPSRIQGSIKAQGTVMIVNRNGIVFSGSSQVNVRNLVAAAANIEDDQFLAGGIYVDANGTQPSFTDALGAITVQAGAQITTNPSATVTQGGGYALLLGTRSAQRGQITTPKARRHWRRATLFHPHGSGHRRQSEFHHARQRGRAEVERRQHGGPGRQHRSDPLARRRHHADRPPCRQDGVAVSTTTVNNRGTIHLLTSASDTNGSVTLAHEAWPPSCSTTAAAALDGQRDALIPFRPTQSAVD